MPIPNKTKEPFFPTHVTNEVIFGATTIIPINTSVQVIRFSASPDATIPAECDIVDAFGNEVKRVDIKRLVTLDEWRRRTPIKATSSEILWQHPKG